MIMDVWVCVGRGRMFVCLFWALPDICFCIQCAWKLMSIEPMLLFSLKLKVVVMCFKCILIP